ncbi:MAG TPA: hypothetical protein VFE61_06045 [Candidatus Sulfotelmatobacter sp.]|nr:hypothetical protein [Candidatus Sulfotelmatobacter sp.]
MATRLASVSNPNMKWLRRTGRALAALVFSVMVITVGTSIYLPIDQYRFRRQAENLLADVRGLQLRKASAEDVRRIVKKWGFEGGAINRRAMYSGRL